MPYENMSTHRKHWLLQFSHLVIVSFIHVTVSFIHEINFFQAFKRNHQLQRKLHFLNKDIDNGLQLKKKEETSSSCCKCV